MAVKIKDVKAVVLDIEGTVCQISFVKDVLFPYALDAFEANLETFWASRHFRPYLEAFPAATRTDPSTFLNHVRNLMFQDSKDACLKNLQGYLWQSGYESGALRCPLFPDVAPTLQKWHAANLPIYIYSSGSVAAQKLLFQYTTDGDLRPFLSGYFDTVNAGPKSSSTSYSRLIAKSNIPGATDERHWLFLSDRVIEVDAATAVGMKALIVNRPGNAPITPMEMQRHEVIESFDNVEIQ